MLLKRVGVLNLKKNMEEQYKQLEKIREELRALILKIDESAIEKMNRADEEMRGVSFELKVLLDSVLHKLKLSIAKTHA